METKTISAQFIALMADLPLMQKDGANPYFSSRYTTLDEIMKGIKPLIAKHKVAITHEVSSEMLFDAEGKIVTTTVLVEDKKDRSKRAVEVPAMLVSVTPVAVNDKGERMAGATMSAVCPQNIQQIGSTVTYLKRYSVSAFLGISADEDDDGNAQAFGGGEGVKVSNAKFEAKAKPVVKSSMTPKQKDELTKLKTEVYGKNSKGAMDMISHVISRKTDKLDLTQEECEKALAKLWELAGRERGTDMPTDIADIIKVAKNKINKMYMETLEPVWEFVKATGDTETVQMFKQRTHNMNVAGEWDGYEV